MSPLLLLIAVVLLGIYLYRNAMSRPPNFPPGPPRLPIWGSYWFLLWTNYKFIHLSTLEMSKRYKTKLLGFFLGNFPVVVACDHGTVHEMLHRPEFQSRPDILVARLRSLGGRYGIIFSDGPEWMELRRFFLRQMRDFGFGRRFDSTEAVMEQEVRDMVDLLRGDWKDEVVCKGRKVLVSQLFAPYALNVLWSMFGAERLTRGHHQSLHAVEQASADFIRNLDPTGRAVSFTPWLQNMPPGGFGTVLLKAINPKIIGFVKKLILEHKDTFAKSHMRDFIDVYLQKMNTSPDGKSAVFNDNQLLLTGMDMTMATATALGGSLTFLFHCLIHHPEVQMKIQNELDEVVGRDRVATINDRQRMPYLEATLRESLRRITVFPMSIPHQATEDTYFRGYFIPKNTIMYANLNAAHMDPEVWGDPENFRPERFLDEEGMLRKKDLSIPFGAGKRLCAGETFSRQMMFLLTAGLMQNFTFKPADPDNHPPIEAAYNGLTLTAVDTWAKIIPRTCH